MHAHALRLLINCILATAIPQNTINACILSGLTLLQGCLLEWKICTYPLDSLLFSAINNMCTYVCACMCMCAHVTVYLCINSIEHAISAL